MLADIVEQILTVRATPEELAVKASDRIISVGVQSHPAVREQALAFKREVTATVHAYIERAVYSERLQMAQALRELGHPELVSLVEQRIKG